jgi:hypothetical protein
MGIGVGRQKYTSQNMKHKFFDGLGVDAWIRITRLVIMRCDNF